MNRVIVFLKNTNKKSFSTIFKEVVVLIFEKKELPYYYFKHLYKRDVNNYLDFLSLKEQRLFQLDKTLHNSNLVDIIDNKLKLAFFCGKHGLSTPALIAYNSKDNFYINQGKTSIMNPDTLVKFFSKIFQENNLKGVFCRPYSSYGGKGCYLLTQDNYKTQLEFHSDEILRSDYLYTEVVKQHSKINAIHSKSINTIRMISLITEQGSIEIICALMRFGVGNSVVDNASSGGFFVNINIDEGTLEGKGNYFSNYGSKSITRHPDSNYEFKDFKIPYYNEAMELVKEAVSLIPNRLIGWDIAIGENGPLIIEGNSKPHMHGADVSVGGLLKNPKVKETLHFLKRNKKLN